MVIYRTNINVQRHTKVLQCITAYGGNFLKLTLTYLYCYKYNEINISHTNTKTCFLQKMV